MPLLNVIKPSAEPANPALAMVPTPRFAEIAATTADGGAAGFCCAVMAFARYWALACAAWMAIPAKKPSQKASKIKNSFPFGSK